MIENLLQLKSQNAAVAFLYCDYRQAKEHTPSRFFGSVVNQLALQQGIPAEGLAKLVRWTSKRENPPTLEESRQLFRTVAEGLSHPYLVIDALDECPLMTRDDLLDELKELGPKFRVLITSRQKFKHYDAKRHLEVKVKALEKDIRKYLQTRVRSSRGFEMDFTKNRSLQEEIVKGIVGTAKGM